jgi:hypothetical protein
MFRKLRLKLQRSRRGTELRANLQGTLMTTYFPTATAGGGGGGTNCKLQHRLRNVTADKVREKNMVKRVSTWHQASALYWKEQPAYQNLTRLRSDTAHTSSFPKL